MKLSDVKGERTMDVVAEIIEPIANISENPAAAALFKREELPDGTDAKSFLFDRVKKNVPALLKDNKSDMIAILAAIEGVTADEYSNSLNLAKLIKDCIDLLTDEAFVAFFTQDEVHSGSAPVNTVEPVA